MVHGLDGPLLFDFWELLEVVCLWESGHDGGKEGGGGRKEKEEEKDRSEAKCEVTHQGCLGFEKQSVVAVGFKMRAWNQRIL